MDNYSFLHVVVLIPLLVSLVGVIWALVLTWNDTTMRTPDKVSWSVALIVLPIIGLVVWLVVSMARRRNPAN